MAKAKRAKTVKLTVLKSNAIDTALGRGVKRMREWDKTELETLEEMAQWVLDGETSMRALGALIRSSIQAGDVIEGLGSDRTHSSVTSKLKELIASMKEE